MKYDNFDVNSWGGYAKCYDALNDLKPYQNLQMTVINNLFLSPGNLILDAACGTGNLPYWLKKNKKEFDLIITGLDFSDEMLELAKEKNQEKYFIFAKHNLNKDIPFADEYFDQIVSVNTLYALSDPARILSEFYRVLKRGGRLILVNPQKGYENGLILKKHCSDIGPNEPWLNVHSSKEREFELLERAVNDIEVRSKLMAVAKFNCEILKNRKFHFLSLAELYQFVCSKKFFVIHCEKVYANQAILIVVQK